MEITLLQELLRIRSVMGAPDKDAPFGKDVKRALSYMLDKGREFGFTARDCEGYCGYIDYAPDGGVKETLGILCHLDVVPEGNAEAWSEPPYAANIIDGKIIARGATDNKGPAAACLIALKRIKDGGVRLNKRVRLIFGCNEENGSECVKYYVKNYEVPDLSFVPDADFPLVISEKAIWVAELTVPADKVFKENVAALSGGDRHNVVPDSARADVIKDSPFYRELITKNIAAHPALSVEKTDGVMRITAKGKAAHAMRPENGDNAVWKLLNLFSALDCAPPTCAVSVLSRYFASPDASERLAVAASDEESGDLTVNLAKIAYEKGRIKTTLDLRCPLCFNKEKAAKKILAAMPKGSSLTTVYYSPNLYTDASSPLAGKLLKVYRGATGDARTPPVKTGGGTYARTLPNAVAFGPVFPGQTANIHDGDEFLSVENYYKLIDIYKAAIIELCN